MWRKLTSIFIFSVFHIFIFHIFKYWKEKVSLKPVWMRNNNRLEIICNDWMIFSQNLKFCFSWDSSYVSFKEFMKKVQRIYENQLILSTMHRGCSAVMGFEVGIEGITLKMLIQRSQSFSAMKQTLFNIISKPTSLKYINSIWGFQEKLKNDCLLVLALFAYFQVDGSLISTSEVPTSICSGGSVQFAV